MELLTPQVLVPSTLHGEKTTVKYTHSKLNGIAGVLKIKDRTCFKQMEQK
jgi:hypothetical protein